MYSQLVHTAWYLIAYFFKKRWRANEINLCCLLICRSLSPFLPFSRCLCVQIRNMATLRKIETSNITFSGMWFPCSLVNVYNCLRKICYHGSL